MAFPVPKEVSAKTNENGEIVINRFNKKKFETLLLALINDNSFAADNAKFRGDNLIEETIYPTKQFKKFCKKILEAYGLDKIEASRIEDDGFVIESVQGLYEFFTEAMYLYMEAGNKFSFPSKKDFRGDIYIKDVPETKRNYKAKNPKDGKIIGEYEKTTKKHKELKVKSSAPKYLSKKRKLK